MDVRPRLPDFLIIGNERCGTSDARRRLQQHPEVFMAIVPARHPSRKGKTTGEAHFFDDNKRWAKGWRWYKRLFAEAGDRKAGDKTPSYVSSPKALRRIARYLPGIPKILFLRNPTTRLWSHFHFYNRPERRRGRKARSFPEFLSGGCVNLGNYAEKVRRLLALFPREEIHIEYTEISAADPHAACRRIHEFIGVTPMGIGTAEPHILGKMDRGRSYRDMPERYRKRFRKHYRKEMKELYKILGDEHIKTWF